MAALSEVEAPAPGLRLGEVVFGYKIERLIGSGGSSRVYLGTHQRMGRPAAIKVLSPQLAHSPSASRRMHDEARMISALSHPHIVDVYDFTEDEPRQCLALILEYLAGPTLKQVLAAGPLDPTRAIKALRQVISAIGAAHEAGVIHRDIKPDNVLFVSDPHAAPSAEVFVKVVDFGIARQREPGQPERTVTAQIGTPSYMAPEQIDGQPPPSRATDVYAIAELVYEVLVGRRVFPSGPLSDVVAAKIAGRIPGLEVPPVPRGEPLLQLIRRALDRKQEARPTLAALDAALAETERILVEAAAVTQTGARAAAETKATALMARTPPHARESIPPIARPSRPPSTAPVPPPSPTPAGVPTALAEADAQPPQTQTPTAPTPNLPAVLTGHAPTAPSPAPYAPAVLTPRGLAALAPHAVAPPPRALAAPAPPPAAATPYPRSPITSLPLPDAGTGRAGRLRVVTAGIAAGLGLLALGASLWPTAEPPAEVVAQPAAHTPDRRSTAIASAPSATASPATGASTPGAPTPGAPTPGASTPGAPTPGASAAPAGSPASLDARRDAAKVALQEARSLMTFNGSSGEIELALKKCLAADDTMAECHYRLGVLYAKMDFAEKSVAHYQRFIELDPTSDASTSIRQILESRARNRR